jgi:hypothetical protein
MTQQEAIDFAREYLWNDGCYLNHEPTPRCAGGLNILLRGDISDYRLHRSLQYHLCHAYKRLAATFGEGEVTKRDIAHIVESWALAMAASGETEDAISQGERTVGQPKGERYNRRVWNYPIVHNAEPTCC